MGYHFMPVRMAMIKNKNKQKKTIPVRMPIKHMEKRTHRYALGGAVNWYGHYGKQNGGSLKA